MFSYKRAIRINLFKKKGEHCLFDFLPPISTYFISTSVRSGLYSCIKLIGLTSRDSVLLPAYLAEGLISPFKRRNINIIFYKSKNDLRFDLNDIKIKIREDKTIKCIAVIHYFGVQNKMTELMEFCKENEILVFEDCAQSLFSKSEDGQFLGSSGDIAFFSLAKTVPVPDGGIFFINNTKLNFILKEISKEYKNSLFSKFAVFFHFLSLLIKSIELKLDYSLFYKIINSITRVLYGIYYFFLRKTKTLNRISNLSLAILERINYEQLIQKRKDNIKYIYAHLNREKHQLLFPDFNENFLFTGVPILSSKRDFLVADLKRRYNIECLNYLKGWNFFPRGSNDFINELSVYNSHFLIPINEDVDIEYIVSTLNNLKVNKFKGVLT
jgi:hypothetical protein